MASDLLHGLRVVDLTTPLAYSCGAFLASMGAEVVRVDRKAGDDSLSWRLGNIGKTCIAIDYEKPEGADALKALVRESDVIVESFTPGVMASLGLGYDALSAIDPGLSMVSITPFGQSGAYAQWQADELIVAAMSSVMSVHGWPDRAPIKEPLDAHFFHAGLTGAMAALIADFYRRRTGLGQWIDISAQELGASRNTLWTIAHQFDGRSMTRCGDNLYLDFGRGPHRRFWELKDGYATGAILPPTQKLGPTPHLAQAMADWMDELGFAHPFAKDAQPEPDANQAWMKAAGDFVKTMTRAEMLEKGKARGIVLNPVLTPTEVSNDPHFGSRNFLMAVDGLGEKPVRIPRWFVTAQGEEDAAPRVPLASGQDALTSPDRSAPRQQLAASAPSALPLAGLKILDFSWAIVGNTATKMMGDLGATIVKIESRTRIPVERTARSVENMKTDGGPNNSPWFANVATSKLGLTLNLKSPEAAAVIDRLVQWSDLVFENFAPGVMERQGLGFETLREKRPDLIMVSASIFGQSGMLSKLPGTDSSGAAHSGRAAMTGDPDRGPTLPSATFGDSITPFAAVAAMLAALRRREETGRGGHIDVSMAELQVQQMLPDIVRAQLDGRDPPRIGNRSDDASPHNVFPTAGDDEWVAISVADDAQWQALCLVLDAPTLASDPRFAGSAQRKANEDALEAEISQLTKSRDRFDLAAKLQNAGIPAGPLQSAADIVDRDPQMKARHYLQPVDHPAIGTFAHQRTPLSLSRTPPRMTPAPLLGEHTEQVCIELLGMDRAQYDELVAEGVFN